MRLSEIAVLFCVVFLLFVCYRLGQWIGYKWNNRK